MNKKWIIIGISGCTNSGKSTLSSFLFDKFPGSIVINQDKYFRPDDSKEHVIIPELNHKNWERQKAVNWEALMQRTTRILNTEPVSESSLIIIEGHIIFNNPQLVKLFHHKYFLTLDKDECYRRRITRVYDPPDIPGYFEKCVWPMYLSNLEEVKRNSPDIVFLNGADSLENIREIVLNNLKTIFNQ